jgi:hypothetical protein
MISRQTEKAIALRTAEETQFCDPSAKIFPWMI